MSQQKLYEILSGVIEDQESTIEALSGISINDTDMTTLLTAVETIKNNLS